MTGSEIKSIRKELSWTQVQLAEALGVTSNTVARWERNEVAIREPMARLIQSIKAQQKKGKR